MEKKEKKMIGRIAKNEEVIIPMLSEDLQEQFDAWQLLKKKMHYADEAHEEENTETTAKEAYTLNCKVQEAKNNFWIAVHSKYGYWKDNIGVRDGYAVVRIKGGSSMGGLPDFLKQMLKEKLKEDLFGGEQEES